MPDDSDQPPIEYRNPADDRPAVTSAGAFIFGLFGGVSLITVCGFSDALWHVNIGGPPSPPIKLFNPSVCAFGLVAIVTGTVGIFLLRREPRRFFLVGFLLGIAGTSIIEGICFSTFS